MPSGTNERPLMCSDGLYVKDDFITNDAVADATVGELDWEIATIGNASTIALVTSQPFGVLRDTTAATADGDGEVYRLFTDGLVLQGGNGGFQCRVRYPDINSNALAGNNFIIGLTAASTEITPTDGIYVKSDAGVLTLYADSADHGDVSVAAAGVSTLTSGTTMVLDTWHTIKVVWTGTNGQGGPKYVDLFVDGEAAGSLLAVIDNDESVEVKMIHWQDSGGAVDLEWDIDYFEFWQFR